MISQDDGGVLLLYFSVIIRTADVVYGWLLLVFTRYSRIDIAKILCVMLRSTASVCVHGGVQRDLPRRKQQFLRVYLLGKMVI